MPYFSKRRVLRQVVRMLQLRDRADSVGRGLALGVFVGITVPWGGQMTVAFLLAWLFGFNRLVAVLATHVTNVITTVPLYILSYYLGSFLLGEKGAAPPASEFARAATNPHALVELVKHLGTPFLVGNFVLGVFLAALGYGLFTRLLRHYHRRHRRHPQAPPVRPG